MTGPTKNITYVVVSALNRMNMGMDDYDRLEQIAIEWYSEVGRPSVVPSVCIDHFYVGNGSRIYPMPSDMIRPTKIGIRVNQYFWTLTRVDQLFVGEEAYKCEDFSAQPQANSLGYTFDGHWYNGVYYGPVFSAGGGFNYAYYTIDEAARQIKFSMDVYALPNGECWIEYLSSGKDVSGNTMVSPAFVEPFRNYLIWQIARFHDNPKYYNQQQDLERIYHETLYNASGNICPSADEIMDALYQVSGYSIR